MYIFSESSQSKDSTGTVPKPNDTGYANYTGWNINGWQLAKMKKSIPDMSLP